MKTTTGKTLDGLTTGFVTACLIYAVLSFGALICLRNSVQAAIGGMS